MLPANGGGPQLLLACGVKTCLEWCGCVFSFLPGARSCSRSIVTRWRPLFSRCCLQLTCAMHSPAAGAAIAAVGVEAVPVAGAAVDRAAGAVIAAALAVDFRVAAPAAGAAGPAAMEVAVPEAVRLAAIQPTWSGGPTRTTTAPSIHKKCRSGFGRFVQRMAERAGLNTNQPLRVDQVVTAIEQSRGGSSNSSSSSGSGSSSKPTTPSTAFGGQAQVGRGAGV